MKKVESQPEDELRPEYDLKRMRVRRLGSGWIGFGGFIQLAPDVAKVRGISAIAQRSDPGRESLYKTQAPGAKPRYATILKVIHSLGVKLTVTI